jgi:hypothetical protein
MTVKLTTVLFVMAVAIAMNVGATLGLALGTYHLLARVRAQEFMLRFHIGPGENLWEPGNHD